MPRKSKYSIPEEKQALMRNIIESNDGRTKGDLQEALKDLLGGTSQSMLEQEMETLMEGMRAENPNYHDSRNGYKRKTLRCSIGEIPSAEVCC